MTHLTRKEESWTVQTQTTASTVATHQAEKITTHLCMTIQDGQTNLIEKEN